MFGECKRELFKVWRRFFKAAHVITEYILERQRIGELDCYFFPVAYLYRHSLELKLKAIAFKYIEDSGEIFIKETLQRCTKGT